MNFETYQLDKRLDSFNYQQAQADILPILERGSNVVLDMTACRYISSAGLRVVLLAHKLMLPSGGKMVIKSPSEFCKQVLSATGMDSILAVEA